MKNKTNICHFDDIPEDGCKGFSVKGEAGNTELFILKRHDKLYAYKNQCPHTGATLNWQPDVFMDYDNRYIQCSIHGARFEVETGLCVWGPCVNQSLTKMNIQISDDNIFLS